MTKKEGKRLAFLAEKMQSIGSEVEKIDTIETKAIIERWRTLHCTRWNTTSKATRIPYAYDFDKMDTAYMGDDATTAYEDKRKYPIDFYVRLQWTSYKDSIVKCSGELPDYASLRQTLGGWNLFVFPTRMKWCFVMTYLDDDVGDPFFNEL